MNTAWFHPEQCELQRYRCIGCGRCCRSLLIGLRPGEKEAIEQLRDWSALLGDGPLFVRNRQASGSWALAKQDTGGCVFLNHENQCRIHQLHGMAAKPLACQLYPFVLTRWGDDFRAGLRFDCPSVCDNAGEPVGGFARELARLGEALQPSRADGTTRANRPAEPTNQAVPLTKRYQLDVEDAEIVNDALVDIAASNAVPLVMRLHWLYRFVDHLERIRWDRVDGEALEELLAVLQKGLLAELRDEALGSCRGQATVDRETHQDQHRPMSRRGRKLLGQFLFILSQPSNGEEARTGRSPSAKAGRSGWFGRLGQRLAMVREMRRLGKTTGSLPRIQDHWPTIDLAELEPSWGSWPEDATELVTRQLVGRLGGLCYWGRHGYGLPMVEGVRLLLVAMVATGWLMRVEAAGRQGERITMADARAAVMTVDGQWGHGSALGQGAARWRLSLVSDELPAMIDRYCR